MYGRVNGYRGPQVAEEREKPAHGDEVDVNGTPCLFLDDGTRKGLWLSPNKAACALANEDKIRIFLAKHPKPPKAELTQLEKDNAAMRAELDAMKAKAAEIAAGAVVVAIERFNPVG